MFSEKTLPADRLSGICLNPYAKIALRIDFVIKFMICLLNFLDFYEILCMFMIVYGFLELFMISCMLFHFWEGFWGVWFLMSFRMAKSRLKIDKVGGLGRPTGAIPVILWRVGGRGGGQQRLLESDRNWQESDNASRTPCTPKGGGGFKGLRPTRRPNILNIWKLSKCQKWRTYQTMYIYYILYCLSIVHSFLIQTIKHL